MLQKTYLGINNLKNSNIFHAEKTIDSKKYKINWKCIIFAMCSYKFDQITSFCDNFKQNCGKIYVVLKYMLNVLFSESLMLELIKQM